MSYKILTPNFSCEEPNIISTRKKNKEGKCCFHDCNNLLSKEEYHYMGFLACEVCGKKLLEDRNRAENEILAEHLERLIKFKDIELKNEIKGEG